MLVLLEELSSKVYLLWCNMQTRYVTGRHLLSAGVVGYFVVSEQN